MKKKLVYVGFAYRHHKRAHAGYHHIKDYLRYDLIITSQKEYEFLFPEAPSFFRRILRFVYAKAFGEGCPFAMLRCLIYSWIQPKDVVFHFIYGDNLYARFFFLLKRKKHQVVITFHQPFESYTKGEKTRKLLFYADKIIVLADNELDKFNSYVGKNNIYFIPHGICTDFYKPVFNSTTLPIKTILMVGNWLRDFDLAYEVFTRLKSIDPNIKINMVGQAERKERFHEYVNYYSDISDNELLRLYQNSNVVYFPLKRFTANNSLLEAASTGSNIVIATDLITDNTYIPNDFILTCNRDIDKNITTLLESLNVNLKTSKRVEMRDYIVSEFSWPIVASRVEKLFFL